MTLHFDRPDARFALTLDQLGTPLSDVTFTVVDLETTGTHASTADVTEIGAVKSTGGEIIGEFTTLVKPERSTISPFVQRLTGITNSMVADAPALSTALPMFLEFAYGTVLVAHNAAFDIGFLKAACARLDYQWPQFQVVDTVKLAQLTVDRSEARNFKLGTLAAYFAAPTTPTHRALDDARATHHVLQCMFDQVGSVGVTTWEELQQLRPQGWKTRQTKRHLAADVPHAPGVYIFVDGAGRVLYVGTSADMHTRVTSYFNASETRGRMAEMVRAAQSVRTIVCPTDVEARVREVRLIDELQPPYNRKSTHAGRATWVTLTHEPFPRLSVVRRVPLRPALGPFRNHDQATSAKDLLEKLYTPKRCTQKVGAPTFRPCAAVEMGLCGGPCSGCTDPQSYARHIAGLQALLAGNAHDFVTRLFELMGQLGATQRYEDAASARDTGHSILRTGAMAEAHAAIRDSGRIIAMRPVESGWDIAIIHRGLLAGTDHVPFGADMDARIRALDLTAASFPADVAGLNEERWIVASWLYHQGTRLIHTASPLAQPATGHGASLASSGLVSAV